MYAMLQRLSKGQRGFTLIELVVVLAILGLLIALALPNYSGARQTSAKDEARVIGQEWRTLEWGCQLSFTTQTTSQCSTDAAIGFAENNVTNWAFVSPTGAGLAPYGVSGTSTVVRCVAGSSTLASGTTYEVFMVVVGTDAGRGPGQSYDQFLISSTQSACP